MKSNVWLGVFLLALTSCGQEVADKNAGSENDAPTKAVGFVTTQEGAPLEIDAALFDTTTAKEFLATGKNSYIGNAEAIASGKKLFYLFSCNACHGGHAEGAVAPGLTGATMKYAKNLTNKGMFETIWHGTNGGMGAKGLGLMVPTDPKEGLRPDEVLKVIAWIRSNASITGNE